jgi:hypothetical protein
VYSARNLPIARVAIVVLRIKGDVGVLHVSAAGPDQATLEFAIRRVRGVQGEVSFTIHSKLGSHSERTTLYDRCKASLSFIRPPSASLIGRAAAVDVSCLILFHHR